MPKAPRFKSLRRLALLLGRHRFAAVCGLFALGVGMLLALTPDRQHGTSPRTVHAAAEAPDSARASWAQGAFAEEANTLLPHSRPAADGPAASLFITSRPVGARVFVDGRLAGMTPLIRSLPSGEHQLSFKKKGYVTRDTTVAHSGRRRSDLLLALKRPADASDDAPTRQQQREQSTSMAPVETTSERHARLRRYIREAQEERERPQEDASEPERAGRDIVGGW